MCVCVHVCVCARMRLCLGEGVVTAVAAVGIRERGIL